MSSGGASKVKYSAAPSYAPNMAEAQKALLQEQQRIAEFNAALGQLQPAAYNMLGVSPSLTPYAQAMLNDILAGKDINESDYTVAKMRGPEPTPPGKKPSAYKFTGSNWGPNDVAQQQAAQQKVADWNRRNAEYKQAKAAWDAAGEDTSTIPGFNVFRAQAQQMADIQKASGQAQAQYFSTATDQTGQSDLRAKLARLVGPEGATSFIDPVLARESADAMERLRGRMLRLMGPGWESSSAGLEALSRFNTAKEEAVYTSRSRDIADTINELDALRQQQYKGFNAAVGAQYQWPNNSGLVNQLAGLTTAPFSQSYLDLAKVYGVFSGGLDSYIKPSGGGGAGGAVAGGLSGLISGAGTGAMVGGWPGAIVGGVVGAGAGAYSGYQGGQVPISGMGSGGAGLSSLFNSTGGNYQLGGYGAGGTAPGSYNLSSYGSSLPQGWMI